MSITTARTTNGPLRDAPDQPHEENSRSSNAESRPLPVVDIEHKPVQDDPRNWSSLRKVSDKLIAIPVQPTRQGQRAKILDLKSEFLLISNFIGCNDIGVGGKHTES